MKKGITSIVVVLMVSMLMMFLVVMWQSRILLYVQRNQGLADLMRATYKAETQIYDAIVRFMADYPLPPEGEKTLEDGTKMALKVTKTGNTETLNVTAKRQFASTQLEVGKTTEKGGSSKYESAELIFNLDCTGSMEDPADPECTGGCTTRFDAMKTAMMEFLDKMEDLPEEDRVRFKIGINAYKVTNRWIRDKIGDLAPTNDIPRLKKAVMDNFGSYQGDSDACQFPNPTSAGWETSLGSPTDFSDNYFASHYDPKIKQIYVVVTDGLPCASMANNQCGTIQCANNYSSTCTLTHGLNYLKCGLADTTTNWGSGKTGLRGKNVDVYAVTVIKKPVVAEELALYNQVVGIFSNPNFVKNYYTSENANKLSEFLGDIFEDVVYGTDTVFIRRIIPGHPTPEE